MFPFKGNYSQWLEAKMRRVEMEDRTLRSKERNLKKELEWILSTKKTKQTLNKVSLSRSLALCPTPCFDAVLLMMIRNAGETFEDRFSEGRRAGWRTKSGHHHHPTGTEAR